MITSALRASVVGIGLTRLVRHELLEILTISYNIYNVFATVSIYVLLSRVLICSGCDVKGKFRCCYLFMTVTRQGEAFHARLEIECQQVCFTSASDFMTVKLSHE